MLLDCTECCGAFAFSVSSVFMIKVEKPTALIILSVIMPSEIMLSVIVLNVVAPAAGSADCQDKMFH